MACLQIYWELLSFATFLRVYLNSKEVSYLAWQNRYPNLKTNCHWLPKFFLWTKLQENLLLPKYLISVAASLIHTYFLNHILLISRVNLQLLLNPAKLLNTDLRMIFTQFLTYQILDILDIRGMGASFGAHISSRKHILFACTP